MKKRDVTVWTEAIPLISKSLETLLDFVKPSDGMACSFHHHFRNGDNVLNMVMEALMDRDLTNLELYPSGIFPVHTSLIRALKENRIRNLTTNYISGPFADALNTYGLTGELTMQTHGGRARAIIEGENAIDVAFIAVSACDEKGNATGLEGDNVCGSLGYAIEDAIHAKKTILITDTIQTTITNPQIRSKWVDGILHVPSIGDPRGIVSGTLSITKDPLGLKIARDTIRFLDESGMIEKDVSFQSGAGGISLAITKMFTETLEEKGLSASFFTGGITKHHVNALEKGLVKDLYDVQCFDLDAIRSLRENPRHHFMSASDYANPNNDHRKIKDLSIVILGAAEVDLDFNVNVTTDSSGTIIGGSGGHSDTAEDAALSIIVSPLLKGRMPLIKDRVTSITTPGQSVDVIITERGIAINPKRHDLLERFKNTTLPLMSIESLQKKAHALSGVPKHSPAKGRVIGHIESRHGQKGDALYRKEG